MFSAKENKVIDWLIEDSRFTNCKSFTSSKLFVLEEATLGEIYDQFYSQLIDRDTYDKLVMVDPTAKPDKKGKYLDWLVRKAYKKNPDILEDESKVKEDLQLFDKFGSKLGKQIGQIKDQYELSQTVKEIREKESELKSNKEKKKEIKLDGADKIYETDSWLILTPKTQEAACYYGKGTRWCTAAEKNNMFDRYNGLGKLYIIINKKDPTEKFQLHFETESFMDSSDDPVKEIRDFIPNDVLGKLEEVAIEADDNYYDWFVGITGRILDGWNVEQISHHICKRGNLYGIAWNYDYDSMIENFERLTGYNSGIEYKIGEYDGEEALWDEVEHLSKDVKYSIFSDGSYFDAEVDISDVRMGLKSWKHLFSSGEAFQKAMEIVDDYGYDEIEGSDEVCDDLITAYRDATNYGAETDALSDFYKAIRYYNDYGLKVVIPSESKSGKFEIWLKVTANNFNDIVSDSSDTDYIFTFGFEEPRYGWSGFDNDYFKGELKRIFKL